ncbi:MAG: hypothetical protein HYY04_12595 [Chloroflexi bacterium]|nr:hypothetical protein [Chloroflexota bacterium]
MAKDDALHSGNKSETRIPAMQGIYDNIWLLFLVSLLVVLVAYIIWGLIDMISRPVLL